MTDVGQKLTLGPRRGLCRLLGLLQRLSRSFLIVNIGEGAEPADDAPRAALTEAPIMNRQRPDEMPAIGLLPGPQEAILGLVGDAGADRLRPPVPPLAPVVRMQGVLPTG